MLIISIGSSVFKSVFTAASARFFLPPMMIALISVSSFSCTVGVSFTAANFLMKFSPAVSSLFMTLWAATISIYFLERGFKIGISSPAPKASAKNAELIASLFGIPNDTLLTPRTVFTPSFSLTKVTALSVSVTILWLVETVSTRQSTIISSLEIPIFSASLIIFSATASLSAAVGGIPFSSSASATMPVPYFFAIGRIFFRLSFEPLTEFIIGLPLYILTACSTAFGSEESI